MERPNAVAALNDKRAEIAGRVDALQDQLRQALIDLDHVDSTILRFDPDAHLDEIKAKPMPPRLMEKRELNQADRKLVKTIQKRVGAALRNMRDRGLVTSERGGQGVLEWRVRPLDYGREVLL